MSWTTEVTPKTELMARLYMLLDDIKSTKIRVRERIVKEEDTHEILDSLELATKQVQEALKDLLRLTYLP